MAVFPPSCLKCKESLSVGEENAKCLNNNSICGYWTRSDECDAWWEDSRKIHEKTTLLVDMFPLGILPPSHPDTRMPSYVSLLLVGFLPSLRQWVIYLQMEFYILTCKLRLDLYRMKCYISFLYSLIKICRAMKWC